VVLLYAGTNGYTDPYPESEMARYETEMLAFMEKEGSAILASIRDKKAIDDATEADLTKALTRFKEIFK